MMRPTAAKTVLPAEARLDMPVQDLARAPVRHPDLAAAAGQDPVDIAIRCAV